MENQKQKVLNKMELVVVIVASLILTLGLIAAVLSIVWIIQGQQNAGLLYAIGVFGDLWTVTSILIIVGVIFNWQPKAMKIISIISICTINAAGLAALLITLKKKPVVKAEAVVNNGTTTQVAEGQHVEGQPATDGAVTDQPKVGA